MTETLLPAQPGTDGPYTGTGDGAAPVVDISDADPAGAPILQHMELTRRHGPLVVQRRHGRDLVLAGGLDLVTELADEHRFSKFVGPALENVREFVADGLFTAYNDEPNWAKAHDILMPAFSLGSMRTYHPVMLKVARRVIASWDRDAARSRPVDVADDMTRMTLDTIGLAGFGFDFGSFGRDTPLRRRHGALPGLVHDAGRPRRGGRPRAGRGVRADADYLASVVDEVIAARTRGGTSRRPAGPDAGAAHPADGTTLDPENIRNQVITFLIAGHETTSGALSFALYYLAKNPAGTAPGPAGGGRTVG